MKTELVGIAGLRLIAVVAAFVEPLFPADVDLVDQQEAADIVVRFAVAGRVVHRAAEAVDLDLRDNREHILGIGGLCKVGRLCDDHHSVPCAVADLCSGDFAVDVNVALEEVVHDVDVTLGNIVVGDIGVREKDVVCVVPAGDFSQVGIVGLLVKDQSRVAVLPDLLDKIARVVRRHGHENCLRLRTAKKGRYHPPRRIPLQRC